MRTEGRLVTHIFAGQAFHFERGEKEESEGSQGELVVSFEDELVRTEVLEEIVRRMGGDVVAPEEHEVIRQAMSDFSGDIREQFVRVHNVGPYDDSQLYIHVAGFLRSVYYILEEYMRPDFREQIDLELFDRDYYMPQARYTQTAMAIVRALREIEGECPCLHCDCCEVARSEVSE